MNALDLSTLRGRLVEIHGSENINLSKHIAPQIAALQRNEQAIVYYIDAGAKLNLKDMPYDWNLLFTAFGLNENTLRSLEPAAEYVDVVVIDSLPYYEGNVWELLAQLRNIARSHNIAVIVVNEYRYVKNHRTGDFEYKPYRFNAVCRYASLAIDADVGTATWLEPQELKYESFVETLRRAS